MQRDSEKLNLPRKYLSYTQYDTWIKSKKLYREIYYENKKRFETRESIFGKNAANLLEKGEYHPLLAKLPKGTHPEYRIETVIEGIPILSFLDSFTPGTNSIYEVKTGRVPWDQHRVDTHDQLPFYCMAVLSKFGHYDPHVLLAWLETILLPQTEIISGITFESKPIVAFTGNLQVFTRFVDESSLQRITEALVMTADEISKDYTEWKEKRGL